MNSYSLKHRVSLQSRVPGKDSLNADTPAWVEVTKLWAAIDPLTGRELQLAQANRSEVTHTVTTRHQVRFANPLDMAKMRIVYGTRVFAIVASIVQHEEHRWLKMSCSDGLNDG